MLIEGVNNISGRSDNNSYTHSFSLSTPKHFFFFFFGRYLVCLGHSMAYFKFFFFSLSEASLWDSLEWISKNPWIISEVNLFSLENGYRIKFNHGFFFCWEFDFFFFFNYPNCYQMNWPMIRVRQFYCYILITVYHLWRFQQR